MIAIHAANKFSGCCVRPFESMVKHPIKKITLDMRCSFRFPAAVAAVLCAVLASAAPVSVRAKLDSVQLLMGRISNLRMEVVQDKGKPGGFPMFSRMQSDGIVSVCGDSVELRTSYKRDTLDLGSGRIQINYNIPIQAFDSGYYRLPEFVYISGTDTARSNRVALKVLPVPVSADARIADYHGVVEPKGKFFDFIPDWVIDMWWLWLSLAVLAALFVVGWRRYRKQGRLLPARPEPSPYEVAMNSLRDLKERKLWEQGLEKDYYTRLTDILRVYLDRRFGINAMEMTSAQIIAKLAEDINVKEKRDYVRRILDVADYVKFARVRPLPADNIAAYEDAVRFVEETKPEPAASETSGASDGAVNKKKGGDA